jgi:hypothetical protein
MFAVRMLPVDATAIAATSDPKMIRNIIDNTDAIPRRVIGRRAPRVRFVELRAFRIKSISDQGTIQVTVVTSSASMSLTP